MAGGGAGRPAGIGRLTRRALRRTGLPFTEPQGAYYVLLDISSLGFARDTDAAEWFVREAGVAGVPGSSFFREPENRYLRFHFAKKEATLRAAGERLLKLADQPWLDRARKAAA